MRQHSEMISLPYINNFRRQQARVEVACNKYTWRTPGIPAVPSPGAAKAQRPDSAISEVGKSPNCPPGLETDSQNVTQHPLKSYIEWILT